MKVELGVKEVFILNVIVDIKEKDLVLSVIVGWKEVMVKGGIENGVLFSFNCEG